MKNSKKCKIFFGSFVLFLALIFGAGSADAKAAAPKLNKKKVTIYVGHKEKLKIKNAKGKVKWASSQKKVAAVSSKGVVQGKKAGKATITAMAGSKKLTCQVTVQNNVSVSKDTLRLSPGKSVKVNVKIRKNVKNMRFKIKDTNVISCKWGKWKGMTIPLTITAKKSGSTYVTITNTYSKEKVKINVTVPSEWDNVEVVIPKTVGEQGYESNRMQITNYSFYKEYDWMNSYDMSVDFKMVKYGKTGKTNWGGDVFFYGKTGNMLKKEMLFASNLALGKSFNDELSVPKETAKIVFMEYPDISGDNNGDGSGGTQDGDHSSTEDPKEWTSADLQKMQTYADKAAEQAKKAAENASKAKKNSVTAQTYTQMALMSLKTAKENMQNAYDYAIVKNDENLVDADGNPSGTLQQRTYDMLSVFDGLEDLTNTDTDEVYKMASDAMTETSVYKLLISKLLSDLM